MNVDRNIETRTRRQMRVVCGLKSTSSKNLPFRVNRWWLVCKQGYKTGLVLLFLAYKCNLYLIFRPSELFLIADSYVPITADAAKLCLRFPSDFFIH